MRWAALALWSVLCVAVGFSAERLLPTSPAPPLALICRPSLPERAILPSKPVVLMFGNSLIFDHDWQLGPAQVVNCARQGLTLSAALPRVASLPALDPTHVILSFGSVEILRAPDTPVDAARFATELAQMSSALQARYPHADLLWLDLPDLANSPAPEVLPILKAALAAQAPFQTNQALAGLNEDISYDGTHLSAAAYQALQRALRAEIR